MKIEVLANDFCPDNCPYFESRYIRNYELGGEATIMRYCTHEHLCEFAVGQYKAKMEADND